MALTMLRRRRRFIAVLMAVAILALAIPVAAAASPSVAAPTSTIKFLTSITFRAEATLTVDVARVEIVIDVEGSTRSEVSDVPTTVKDGPATLSYVLDTPGGDLLPNTDVSARFRLTLKDGSTVLGAPTSVHYDDTRYSWKTLSGTFVKVHYTEGGTSFGQRAVKIGDDAVRDVSKLLGVTENDPIDFYVYADRTAFYDVLGPGTRENVGGEARPEIRTLFANIAPSAVDDPWVGIVIPHELTHLVFDSAVRNAYHYPPRWLNEGIAVYLSEGYGSTDRSDVADAVDAGSIMPLSALAAQFPTSQARFYLAYSESVAAVSFLVQQYGRDAMVALVTSYKGGVSDDEAFQAALKTDVAGFEAAWLKSIGAKTPKPFGPQPPPAGPLPSGWAGAAATPGTAPEESPAPTEATSGETPIDGDGGTLNLGGLALLAGAVVVIGVGLRRRRSSVADQVGWGSPTREADAVAPPPIRPSPMHIVDAPPPPDIDAPPPPLIDAAPPADEPPPDGEARS